MSCFKNDMYNVHYKNNNSNEKNNMDPKNVDVILFFGNWIFPVSIGALYRQFRYITVN